MIRAEWRSLFRKSLILSGLVACIVCAPAAPVQACVDYFACQDGCDYEWMSCRIVCQGYPTPDIYACQDSCDTIYGNCEASCGWNACV
jgi:hypothetical protein